MTTALIWAMSIPLAAAAIWAAIRGADAYFKSRGERLVTCPENRQRVLVEVDAVHAAASALRGARQFRLAECTRWPEKRDCGQECLSQIERAPTECLVRNILAGWYAGKECVFCRKSFDALQWHDHRPALLVGEGRILAWKELEPERIPELLAEAQAVCWNCHVAESFRLRHPELVVDRDFQGSAPKARAS